MGKETITGELAIVGNGNGIEAGKTTEEAVKYNYQWKLLGKGVNISVLMLVCLYNAFYQWGSLVSLYLIQGEPHNINNDTK